VKERVNKTQWILQQNLALGPSEVAHEARKLGLDVTAQYVSMVRYNARKLAEQRVVALAPALVSPRPPKPRRRMDSLVKDMRDQSRTLDVARATKLEFERLIVRIGTDEARRLLDGLRAAME
jgi:hypothetical protein